MKYTILTLIFIWIFQQKWILRENTIGFSLQNNV